MTQKEQQLLTVFGTLFAVVIIVVLVAVPYVRKLQFYDKKIAERQTQIYNYKRQIANKPALQGEIQMMNEVMDAAELFLRDVDKASAASALLSSVKKIVEDANGDISSVNMIQQKNSGNKVTAKVNFTIDNDGLIEVMKNLSASKPLMPFLLPVVVNSNENARTKTKYH